MIFNSDVKTEIVGHSKHPDGSEVFTCLINIPSYELINILQERVIVSLDQDSLGANITKLNNNPYKPNTWFSNNHTSFDVQQQMWLDNLYDSYVKALSMTMDTFMKLNVDENQYKDICLSAILKQGYITFTKKPSGLNVNTSQSLCEEVALQGWHLPYIQDVEYKGTNNINKLIPISAYRLKQMGEPFDKNELYQFDKGVQLIHNNDPVCKHILRACDKDSNFNESVFRNWNSLTDFNKLGIEYFK